jgi:hypothetical protein
MEKLLQWSTAQESNDPEIRARAPVPDPKILAQVLGANTGKDDTQLMKEDISVLICNDPQITVDDKLTALEDFEILIQNLDNANNISPMGIWPEIAKLYTYKGEEEDEFRGLAALITGTAVQNNNKCQNDFLKIVGNEGLKDLIQLLNKENHFNVRARALYAISGLVAHHGSLYEMFVNLNGWDVLSTLFDEKFENNKNDNKVLLRSLNLFKSLLYDEVVDENKEPIISKTDRFEIIKKKNIFKQLVNLLTKNSHFDVNERILGIFIYVLQNGYIFTTDELNALKIGLSNISKDEYNSTDISTLEKLF